MTGATESTQAKRWNLFEAFGIELEYMVVDRDSLNVRPIVADLIAAAGGVIGASDYLAGAIGWSNELVSHVVELKAAQPVADLRPWLTELEQSIARIDRLLGEHNAMLLPTAMHPWMNPREEAVLWPHENHQIYAAFDRIFDCRQHGWANVQSVHLNLPFADAEQFATLHAAVRLVLPLLPAIAASSPLVESALSGQCDNRLVHYRQHCHRVPSLVGDIIPEPIFDEASYRRQILARIYEDIRPFDPDGVLCDEFLNARGAITRFDRGSIEIRLIDVQECPLADLAICALVVAVVRALAAQTWQSPSEQQQAPTSMLASILDQTIRQGGHARIEEANFLAAFGLPAKPVTASILWQTLAGQLRNDDSTLDALFLPLDVIFEHGTLSRRIVQATGYVPTLDDLRGVYSDLAICLTNNEPFLP